MTDELPSIAQAQHLLRERLLRPIDLVEHCLERIEQLDGQIKAWVLVDADGAKREAERLGEMLAEGETLGPLHGIPLGIKDIIDVAGWPTKCGSPLREGHVAARDAAVVTSLRKAGAILLGKTVTTEWACFDPAPTRNPWNLDHTPGGSSSGSAAAVAADMCLAALGTQTGGSIIRPAAFCGVAGFKPGFGEVGLEGIERVSLHLDHVGPIARRVGDLYAVWQALVAGTHGSMESLFSKRWADSDLDSWIDAYGMNKTLFTLEGPLLDRMTDAMRDVYERTLDRLRPAIELRPLPLPDSFNEIHAWHRRIMAAEAAAYHRDTFPSRRDQYGPNVAALLDEGKQVAAVDYAEALIRRQQLQQEMAQLLHRHEDLLGCLVMPATLGPAPLLDTTGDPAFNSPWSYLGWPAATIPCQVVGTQVVGTLRVPSPDHGTRSVPATLPDGTRSVPATSGGLPCGLQFIAMTPPQVFAMAGLCERLLGFHERPPLLENLE